MLLPNSLCLRAGVEVDVVADVGRRIPMPDAEEVAEEVAAEAAADNLSVQ